MANTHRGFWPPTDRQIQLFWRKYHIRGEDECWPWKNELALDDKGYAHATLAGWITVAHRISFALTKGISPYEAPPVVMHSCDYRRCGNPKHLVGATQKQNLDDMRAKGRAGDNRNFGEQHGRCVVSDEQVDEIVSLYAAGTHSQRELAKKFGLGGSQIGRLVRGESRITKDRKTTPEEAAALATSRKEATDPAAWSKKGGRHMAKLYDHIIKEICYFSKEGISHSLLAEMNNVSRQTIDQIVNNETYKHVDRNALCPPGHYAPPFSLDHMWDFEDRKKAEANLKRSQAKKGRKFTAEHRANIALAARRRKKAEVLPL
jgi:plasmid maintenance system antidote protein VapI